MKPRVIYYYQTLDSLQNILYSGTVTHIHLSSIHFGFNSDGSPYIHLNDYHPTDQRFDKVWQELFIAKQNGIQIILMMGGAGGAFQDLFSHYHTFYPLLKSLLEEKSNIISGLDLDIEEEVPLPQVENLIQQVRMDFGKTFTLTMAPIQSSLQNDQPGMGGFIYKDLYASPVGKEISYFNGQFYQEYTQRAYQAVVENGYPETKVVMGMLMGQDFSSALIEIKKLYEEYGDDFGGVFIWEYSGAPSNWSVKINQIFTSEISDPGL